jgi:hypothetical protein
MSVIGRVPSRGVMSSTAAVIPRVDPSWGPPELADPLEAPGGVGICGSWSGMGRRGADGPRAPAGRRFCAPFVLTAMRPASVAPGLVEHEARARERGVGSQKMVMRRSAPQRIRMTEKMSVMASPEGTAVATGWTRSPGRSSASSSFDVASDTTSLVVASPEACKFEPGGEAGGSAAPEEPELESDRVSVAGAVPGDVPIGSFVVVKESAAASVGSTAEASAELAEGSVAVRPSVVSVGTGASAHVPVVSAAAAEVSIVVAEVAVASGTEAHVLVVSGAAAELSVVVAGVAIVSGVVAAEVSIGFGVVVAEVSIASDAGVPAPAPAVFAAAADPSAVVAEVPVASGAGARVSVVPAVPELSVVAADVSEVSVGAMPSDDAVAAASLGVESVVIAETSETGEGGSSPRAGAANRDAQSTAANTATAQPTNPRPRLRSKRGGRIPETAAELPSISASSPWLAPLVRAPSIALDIRCARLRRQSESRAGAITGPPLG